MSVNLQTREKHECGYLLNDGDILAGTSPSGLILKSNDNGLTFSNIGSVGKGNPTCFIQLANGDVLYGTDAGYVVNYTKGTSIFVYSDKINSICSNGTNIIYVGFDDSGELFKSVDAGVSYNEVDDIGTINQILYTNGNFIAFATNGITWSFDNFTTQLQAGNFSCACDVGSGVLYAGDTSGHIWKSVNSGEDWSDLGAKVGGAFNSLIYNNSRFILHYGELWYSDNDCSSFTYSDTEIVGLGPLVAVSSTILLAGGINEGDIWRSVNNGTSWSEISGNPQQGEDSINCLIKYIVLT